jgi:hypothetical protein
MAQDDIFMESRVNNLEVRLIALEHQVQRVTDAVLGTTEGKAGIMEVNRLSLEASRFNSLKLDDLSLMLDEQNKVLNSIQQDRSKVVGGMFVMGIIWTILALILKYVI